MTCITAIVDEKGVVYFAGDSLVVTVPSAHHSGVSQTIRRESKVWIKDGMLFGANGSVRMLQLLRYTFNIPEYTAGQDKVEYLVKEFIPEVQHCFIEANYQDDELNGNILLSLGGELFTIGKEFGVCNTIDHYESVGKACEVAIGSLYTTEQLKLTTRQRLYLALKAAERHTCVVSEPFMYISSEMSHAEILTG